jgi:V/A-type H+-transporting ATPase subunit I
MEELERRTAAMGTQQGLLATLGRLTEEAQESPGLVDLIGVTVRRPEMLAELVGALEEGSGASVALATALAPDGTTVGLLVTTAGRGDAVRRIMDEQRIAELDTPQALRHLPPARQAEALGEELAALRRERDQVEEELQRFARRWRPFYDVTLEWLDDSLALLRATSEVLETDYCFCLRGWLPADDVSPVRAALEGCCAGEVVVQEQELKEEELERAPVMLRNPPFLRPFEILARLVPLPRYTSYDPTPFLALFVPLFFGLMLGDAGYGALLLLAALLLLRIHRRGVWHDLAWVLAVCAGFGIAFGLVFGEVFGEAGGASLGLHPLFLERSTALMPMLGFTLAVGAAHVGIGLLLAVAGALRRRQTREAIAKGAQLLSLTLLLALVGNQLLPLPPLPLVPLLSALGLAMVLLLAFGGLLAPLEMLKTVGNVISYARLMAIGLTSVMLAETANSLAGLGGSVLAGALAAGLLHIFTLLLGVFAPAVHALRLHYVEFFGKFLEPGGRSFQPLARPPHKEE